MTDYSSDCPYQQMSEQVGESQANESAKQLTQDKQPSQLPDYDDEHPLLSIGEEEIAKWRRERIIEQYNFELDQEFRLTSFEVKEFLADHIYAGIIEFNLKQQGIIAYATICANVYNKLDQHIRSCILDILKAPYSEDPQIRRLFKDRKPEQLVIDYTYMKQLLPSKDIDQIEHLWRVDYHTAHAKLGGGHKFVIDPLELLQKSLNNWLCYREDGSANPSCVTAQFDSSGKTRNLIITVKPVPEL